jgi:tetratricopeptide (TPR) repeat protein
VDRKSSSRRTVYRLVKEGQIEKAIETFAEFLSSGEAGPYDFVYMGDMLIKVDRPDEAIERYDEAIAAYGRLGFNRNAVALARKILRLDPGRWDTHRRLGDLYAADELIGDALYAYFDYLDAAPEEVRQEESFRETVQRLEELAIQRADFARRLSEYLRRAERFEAAVGVLTRAAEFAELEGRDAEARDLRDRISAIGPSLMAGTEELDGAGDGDAAVFAPETEPPAADTGEEKESAAPQETGEGAGTMAFGEIKLAAAAAGEPDAADAAEGKPPVEQRDFQTHYDRGVELMEREKLDEALAEFEAAACDYDLTPEQAARLQETRGECFALLGRHREAIREFVLLVENMTGEPSDIARRLTLLAYEYEAVGELDEARQRLEKALEVCPDHAEAADALGRLERGAA